MDDAAWKAVYSANAGVNIGLSRAQLPKSGPKPAGERPPCNTVTPVFLDEIHEAASVRNLD
eukprot:5223608-Amphidinium_carterae.2